MSLWVSLDEGGEDLGVFPEVPHKSVTTPMSHDLHCLYRHAAKQIEESGANTNSMSLEGL